jgi:hypothetical protein
VSLNKDKDASVPKHRVMANKTGGSKAPYVSRFGLR